MGRRKKEFNALPTRAFRCRAWARQVRWALLPGLDPARPYADRMDGAIRIAAGSATGVHACALETLLLKAREGKQIASSGRWHSWWKGAQPQPNTIWLLEVLVPGTSYWMEPEADKAPLQNFFRVIDIWAGKQRKSEQAMIFLMGLSSVWGPKMIATWGHSSVCQEGWGVGIFPGQRLPAELARRRYNSLEPSSIVGFMLWLGAHHKINETENFLDWVFDLVAGALATTTLLQEAGWESEELGGESSHIAAFVIEVFVFKFNHYINPATARIGLNSYLKILNRDSLDKEQCLPADEHFIDLMVRAVSLFQAELLKYGILVEVISALNPQRYWFEMSKKRNV